MIDTELRRTLARLIAVRAVIATLLLGGATWEQSAAPGAIRAEPFFFLIALTYGLTVAYALTLRFVDEHEWLVDVQLAADTLIVSAFISLTGGVASFFTSLYGLPIIASSVLRFRRGGLIAATQSALLYVGIVVGQYRMPGEFPHGLWFVNSAAPLPTPSVAQFTVVLNLFGFFAIALLSGSLADRLRSAGARLQRASSEIAGLQAFNQDVIDSLPSGLATTDVGQRILTFNHAAEAITGLSLAEVAGHPVAEVFQFTPGVTETFTQGLAGAGVRRLELRYRTGNGRGDIALGLSATHLETPGGRTGYLITFQDVTEIKKLERDAHIQQRLAAVGEMAAGIAHEIRNPLASISGSIQILREEIPLSADQERLMDIVMRESDRLNTTIRAFLDYARPQRFAIARFDIRRALNDTALLLRNSSDVLARHAIDIDVPSTELSYEADEGQIRQIVWNLATNGIRAMPEGGRLRLSARLEPSNDAVVISVQDEGIGIASDELDRLFQPFHGTFAKGSGLGLAIVHRIVADYHGEIQVSSQPGAGTTVAVRLPARVGVLT